MIKVSAYTIQNVSFLSYKLFSCIVLQPFFPRRTPSYVKEKKGNLLVAKKRTLFRKKRRVSKTWEPRGQEE